MSSLSFSFQNVLTAVPAASLEVALVLAPQTAPLRRLSRLRSPLWAALLPVWIIVGTFGLIAMPRSAPATLMIAAVTTPVLAVVAIVAVVRARWLLAPVAILAGGLALLAGGVGGQLGAAVITALACLTVGAALQRLIPGRWLLVGVLAMALADIALVGLGFGHDQSDVLAAAARGFHGPRFTGAPGGRYHARLPGPVPGGARGHVPGDPPRAAPGRGGPRRPGSRLRLDAGARHDAARDRADRGGVGGGPGASPYPATSIACA